MSRLIMALIMEHYGAPQRTLGVPVPPTYNAVPRRRWS
jgi:hypothetical protein